MVFIRCPSSVLCAEDQDRGHAGISIPQKQSSKLFLDISYNKFFYLTQSGRRSLNMTLISSESSCSNLQLNNAAEKFIPQKISCYTPAKDQGD